MFLKTCHICFIFGKVPNIGNIHINTALKKGKRMLRYYPLTLLTVLMFGSLWLGAVYCDGEWLGTFVLVGFISAFTLPLIFYQLMLPRWRIWAFENVRNVHELKKRAMLIKIYPAEGAFEWKLEIKTTRQKERIAALDKKFELPDVFIDDESLPEQTVFDHPKLLKCMLIALGVVGMGFAIYFFLTYAIEVGTIALVSTGVLIYPIYETSIQKGPVFTISNNGISTDDQAMHAWEEIAHERVEYRGGSGYAYILTYEVNGQTIYIDIPNDADEVDHALHIYRGRHVERKKS